MSGAIKLRDDYSCEELRRLQWQEPDASGSCRFDYSPELNPVENIWQFLRQTNLSNQVFEDYDKIVDACCNAWNSLINEASRITSIASKKWARNDQ
ncbi:MAG: hypothetical protein GY927_06695 [bacterium]|nr:hypothetical protein [bacterium]